MLSGSWIVDILQLWSFSSLKKRKKFQQTNKQTKKNFTTMPPVVSHQESKTRERTEGQHHFLLSMLHWDRNKNYLNTAYHSDKSHDVVHIQDTFKKKQKKKNSSGFPYDMLLYWIVSGGWDAAGFPTFYCWDPESFAAWLFLSDSFCLFTRPPESFHSIHCNAVAQKFLTSTLRGP